MFLSTSAISASKFLPEGLVTWAVMSAQSISDKNRIQNAQESDKGAGYFVF